MRGPDRARLDKIDGIRQRDHSPFRETDELGEHAIVMLARNLHGLSQRLVPGETVSAMTAELRGVQDDLHACGEPARGVSLRDFAGAFNAQNDRRIVRSPDTAISHVEIDAIERRCAHAHENFTGFTHTSMSTSQTLSPS
jgi:hypothetical protein